tara:strand:+ start:14 stop:823 length:810 start_codon:yes stop_codon:yes gene_type:complete
MKIFKSFNVLNREINFNKNIGFVPTMGSLHKGHIYLIKKAKFKLRKVLVSIFVNPTQFNDKKDFNRYPRNINKDISILRKLGVDYVFIPKNNEIYNKGIMRKIKISKKDKVLCARRRIGHFEGVLAVINRLLENINAKFMYLGEKDFQQIFLIKKYLQNKFKTKIVACKTIRNKNKLPLSSRNVLLNKNSLKNSENISKILYNFKRRITYKFSDSKLLESYLLKIKLLCDKVEYFEIRNSQNLSKKFTKKNFKIFIAYKQGNVRLIDNF